MNSFSKRLDYQYETNSKLTAKYFQINRCQNIYIISYSRKIHEKITKHWVKIIILTQSILSVLGLNYLDNFFFLSR